MTHASIASYTENTIQMWWMASGFKRFTFYESNLMKKQSDKLISS